jgi:hypothetical protein
MNRENLTTAILASVLTIAGTFATAYISPTYVRGQAKGSSSTNPTIVNLTTIFI